MHGTAAGLNLDVPCRSAMHRSNPIEHDLAFFERQLSKYANARSPWERAMAATYAGLLLGTRSALTRTNEPGQPPACPKSESSHVV